MERFFLNEVINRIHLGVMSISERNEVLGTLEYISHLSKNNQCPYQNNYFMILDKWKVYISELENYMITSRLKYQF